MTYVFKLTERSSFLTKGLSHPIINTNLKVGLIGFYTTYSTPNITDDNNKLYYESTTGPAELVIPTGQYNVNTLERYINSQSPFDTNNISITGNDATNRVDIKSPFKLYFHNKSECIDDALGFDEDVESNITQSANHLPKFHPFETIDIHCDLANGMILKNTEYQHKKSDIIASFRTNAEFKEPIIYEPTYPLFFPLQHLEFDSIQVCIRDQDGVFIDFGDSLIVTVILKVYQG